jgi:hypothetical protein
LSFKALMISFVISNLSSAYKLKPRHLYRRCTHILFFTVCFLWIFFWLLNESISFHSLLAVPEITLVVRNLIVALFFVIQPFAVPKLDRLLVLVLEIEASCLKRLISASVFTFLFRFCFVFCFKIFCLCIFFHQLKCLRKRFYFFNCFDRFVTSNNRNW